MTFFEYRYFRLSIEKCARVLQGYNFFEGAFIVAKLQHTVPSEIMGEYLSLYFNDTP